MSDEKLFKVLGQKTLKAICEFEKFKKLSPTETNYVSTDIDLLSVCFKFNNEITCYDFDILFPVIRYAQTFLNVIFSIHGQQIYCECV